jgi:hypothetical protein
MLVELDVSAIVPSISSVSRQLGSRQFSLPSTGSLGSVPPLHRYYGPLGLLAVHRVLSGRLLPRLASFPSLGATAFGGDDKISQVPGEPS